MIAASVLHRMAYSACHSNLRRVIQLSGTTLPCRRICSVGGFALTLCMSRSEHVLGGRICFVSAFSPMGFQFYGAEYRRLQFEILCVVKYMHVLIQFFANYFFIAWLYRCILQPLSTLVFRPSFCLANCRASMQRCARCTVRSYRGTVRSYLHSKIISEQ